MVASIGRVLVSLVTRNDAVWLPGCMESLHGQTVPLRIRALDNDSSDESVSLLRMAGCEVVESTRNLGFSHGHNANLARLDFDFALVLNADTRLDPRFVEELVRSFGKGQRVGMTGGKLLRMRADGETARSAGFPVLDSTGIYFTPTQRHFDRGSGEPDRGQYDRLEQVFGITGAAMMVSREFVDDLRPEGEFFDEDFFAYREDADLSWRAQLRGWKALYQPAALGRHVRRGGPGNRRRLDRTINYHSVKNRFLMRTKNMDWGVWWRCFPWLWLRDLGILGYVATREPSSGRALLEAYRLRPRMLAKRRVIQGRRLATPAEIKTWFSYRPAARALVCPPD